ncbi:DEAD/DEAH box helicase [Chitinibacter sp. S2-10]|uniref:DEAD/DEAH box helicase n=1 Tax=Chitinibacter sp. S2-10 TaxID=3373597 RepID=UPI00397727CB
MKHTAFNLDQIDLADLPVAYMYACYGPNLSQTAGGMMLVRCGYRIDIKAAIGRLMLARVIHNQGQNFSINEDWRWDILAHLKSIGELEQWLSVALEQRNNIQPWQADARQAFTQKALQAALLNAPEQLGSALYHMTIQGVTSDMLEHHPARTFFGHASAKKLFIQLSPKIQSIVLGDYLHYANLALLGSKAQYAYIDEHFAELFAGDEELAGYMAWQSFLRGLQGNTLKYLHMADPETEGELRLALCTAEDRHEQAIGIANTLLDFLKRETGKRKLALPGFAGLFYSASLLSQRQNQTALKALQMQFEAGDRANESRVYEPHLNWVKRLINPAAPRENRLVYAPPPLGGLHTLFDLLLHSWGEFEFPADWQAHLELILASWQEYDWAREELALIIDRHFDTRWATPGWHAANRLTPLIDIVQLEPAWQRALLALSQFNKSPDTAPAASTRLAWLLTAGRSGILLEPREQKVSTKGVWSKGRAVALKRLLQGDVSLNYLSEQDKRISRYISTDYGYYGESGYTLDGEAALPDLVGHPYVYWSDSPDVRIDIVAGEITLQLKESAGKISLKLDPAISAGNTISWKKETPTRLAVYQITPEVTQIAGILGKGLTVPAEAKSHLVDAITAIAPLIAIHSDLPELSAHLESVAANPLIHAHLLPIETGLRLQFLVRPLAESGWFIPGKGAANVVGELEGRTVQAERDLKAEKAAHQAVLNHCTALANAELEGNDWQLDSPELCLELLAQLRELPGVELVWPEGERFRLKASRSMSQLKLGIKQQGDWFVVNGEIELDDGKVLQLRQLLQLLDKSPGRFIQIGDNDYLALTDNLRRRLEELRTLADDSRDGLKMNLLASNALAELASEAGEVAADKAWQAHLAKLDSLAQHQPKVPSTLQATLRDYQLEGFQWLSRLAHWGVGACLADDMGLGKTVQTLALLLERAPNGPALVVAPTSVAINWQAEAAKFAPTLKIRNYQNERSLGDLSPFDLIIVSYGLFQQDAEAFATAHWHTVVLDEAQAIKNSQTRRSQAAMSLNADFKMIATGTPMENHLGELWNLFRFINPALLGSQDKFNQRFATPIANSQTDPKGSQRARAALKQLIQPFMLRRTKTQVLSELPSRTEITHKVALSREELHLYEALRQQAVEKIDSMNPDEGNKPLQVLAEITKLRRFCCNPKLVMKDSQLAGSKLAAFAEITEELLDNGHKALVFSQFVDHLSIVREWLDGQGIAYQYLDGATPVKQRQKAVNDFQAGIGDVFLISLKAGGSGLNLTAADYVIHLDPWWNPAVEDQASDRAHRMGQQRPVTIYRLVAEGTIEEQIVALHSDKRDLADSLLEGGDASGKLDNEALLNLLRTVR